jgi:hypothetical protein
VRSVFGSFFGAGGGENEFGGVGWGVDSEKIAKFVAIKSETWKSM